MKARPDPVPPPRRWRVNPRGFTSIPIVVLLALSLTRASGGDEVGILVLKEHGVGSPTLAQPYVDRFVELAAKQNGWNSAHGQYVTNRSAARKLIEADKPHYGFSLPAFLDMRRSIDLVVIGRVASSLAGGRQYFVVGEQGSSLESCKGAKLASDHLDDARFVERVVARGQFKLDDFVVVQDQRPLQSIKQLLAGQARCALIDEAQFAELPHLEGAAGVHAVWESARLPPMTVVALPSAPAAEREAFAKNLKNICDDDGQSVCAEVGISSLEAATERDYATVLKAYGD